MGAGPWRTYCWQVVVKCRLARSTARPAHVSYDLPVAIWGPRSKPGFFLVMKWVCRLCHARFSRHATPSASPTLR